MDGKHYKLRILPLFEEDLNEIVDYISTVSYTHLDVYKRQPGGHCMPALRTFWSH